MTYLRNILILFMISVIVLQGCKQAEEAVNFLQNEKKQKIQDKDWEVNWDKTYEGASVTALITKNALKILGTGAIRFQSDGKFVYKSSLTSTKDFGKWDINALNQLTISETDKSAVSVIPTTSEDLFFSLIKNATIQSVTDTELHLTPGLAASLLGLGSKANFYFQVKK